MVQEKERVIRPPIEQVTSGRVFQPTYAFIGKKMLKVGIIVLLIWVGIWALFLGLANEHIREILLAVSQPLELLVVLGWETANLIYMIAVVLIFLIGTTYVTIYVKKIEYSVLGWTGDSMPEIYTKRGIITITKRHVPFRTITHVQTRRGIFDRIMGIGTVLIETAGGAVAPPASGLLPLLIQKLGGSGSSEERIEGIRFHEELRDYILRVMREVGSSVSTHEVTERVGVKKRIFTRQTLEAFKEVRDALKESQATGGE
ncbi:MAG: PH domain-containing protein [Candidatus Thorarchaeota archaeon]